MGDGGAWAQGGPTVFKTAGRHPWRCRRTDRSRRAPAKLSRVSGQIGVSANLVAPGDKFIKSQAIAFRILLASQTKSQTITSSITPSLVSLASPRYLCH